MTHAIKQIVDTNGEPMMEVVVHSDCSAVDMDAIHAEALEMNDALDAEFASIDELAPDDNAKAIFKAIASKYEVGCVMGVNAAHTEALKMNTSYA